MTKTIYQGNPEEELPPPPYPPQPMAGTARHFQTLRLHLTLPTPQHPISQVLPREPLILHNNPHWGLLIDFGRKTRLCFICPSRRPEGQTKLERTGSSSHDPLSSTTSPSPPLSCLIGNIIPQLTPRNRKP
ncbi:hypothetical protein mRhiFer1_008382 [Rhinolophus ferrumequinum]|uniref:Uncharacterized protein n=1 Tax=Rhinolophus ferrumequinum TaxID=59479 RepID=A0A7J7VDY3_RHIFE|nr:hypothetical protein mRhiFer1_008382 [Rhinolophus ferrumequinum]